ncbi:iron complex transport system substrate-binding protein [Streptosporangium becharense]|uniref:Iron complex transport system substrate-binding protein n=1 Tax=Streptosporangium becharense TaxID=1816182 RepID=A0A7W9MFQ7_9ACTN|nr:ABC transporter substrate-binding protein [Streptosporangium becharense]MBB2912001.1 iron complex transport system substrate-binding protein [Streptosporangium becharense]MBB5818548.1 iron complex transport system substrate-binding protein [Streptosporangium becharense]
MRPLSTALAGALFAALSLAGCGGQGTAPAPSGASAPPAAPAPSGASAPPAAPASPGAAGFPVTVEAGNGSVTVAARPERIVSLSPTATESLFAIGAGPQVVAVDDQSDHPAEAPKSDLSGFKPNVEAIIARKPDLVVLANDVDGVVADLGKVGVPVLLEPAATKIDEAYDQIADLGAATGNTAKAAEVVAGMRKRLGELAAAAPKDAKLTYYHELDSTPYTATSATFIGQVYALFGLTNIADKAPAAAGGYPKLAAEFVPKADPDLIFLADTKCCGQSKETVAKRPGWSGLSAVENDQVVPLDDDIASRWGPRVVDLAEQVATAVEKAAAG